MAIHKEGIMGSFSGKVGPLVGASWRGIPVVRSAPKKSNKPPTSSQLLCRERFRVVEAFLNPMSEFLKTNFSIPVEGKTPRNVASTWNNPYAIDETGDKIGINYSKVLLSQGILREMEQPQLLIAPLGSVKLNWKDNSHQAMAWADDILFAVLYAPDVKEYLYFSEAGLRSDTTALLQLPETLWEQELHCWAGFKNDDLGAISNSVYAGVR